MKARLCSATFLGLVLALGAWLVPGPAWAQMQVMSGTYVGNGRTGNISVAGLGFQPDVVVIKGNVAQQAVIATSSMPAGQAKQVPGALAPTTTYLQSLDADGFTVGTGTKVNGTTATSFYWTAFKAAAGELAVGTYTGNGGGTAMTVNVGFQPDYVVIMSSGANQSVQRSSAMTNTFQFAAAGSQGTLISGFVATGFTITATLNASVNTSAVTYYYIAWKAVAGRMAVGSYTGNGTSQSISAPGFQPVDVWIKQNGTVGPARHPAALGASTDSTLNFTNVTNFTGGITALQSSGFQVGANSSVNTSGTTYYWMAFGGISCAAVSDASYVAANAQASQNTQALLYWSSSNPALVLRKAGSALTSSEAPAPGAIYPLTALVGGATVAYDGAAAAAGFTDTGLTAGTRYYYKVFARAGTSNACYAPGKAVNAILPSGTNPTWNYMIEGGPILKAGITGDGTIYTSSNASRIVSLSTATGTPSWAPVATTGPIQGWLSWLPAGSGGGIKAVQSGSVTLAGATQTVTLTTAVNPAKSFVLCWQQSASSDAALRVLCDLTNGSTVTFYTSETGQVVQWYVVEFKGGVLVQRGSATFQTTDMTVNVPISAADLSRSFVLTSRWTSDISQVIDEEWTVRAQLTSPTNLELARNTGAANYPVTVGWQVVQMAGAAVQRGTTSINSGTQNFVTVPLSPSVDPTKSFLVFSRKGPASGGIEGEYQATGEITGGGSTLTFTRVSTTTNSLDIAWEVVSLSDGTTVQRGAFTPPDASDTAWNITLSPAVNRSQSVPLISVRGSVGPTATADLDSTSFSAVFTNSDLVTPCNGATCPNLQLTKVSSVDVVPTIAWQVVQFSPTAGIPVVLGGDQSGNVYSVDPTVGAQNWSKNLKAVTGGDADAVQAPVSAQVLAYSVGTFPTTYTDDVLFAATSNSSGAPVCGTANTNNKIFALKVSDGTVLWTFNLTCTSNVDTIVAQPWVDYARNRIYVASRAGASGTQSSLWVIRTSPEGPNPAGSLVTSIRLSHLQTSPTMSFTGGTLYVGDLAGNLYAIDLTPATPVLKWTVTLGGNLVGFLVEDVATPGRLYLSVSDNTVRCLQDTGATATACWASPATVTGPSTPVLIAAPNSGVFVGSSDGNLYQLAPATGGLVKTFAVDGTPSTVGDASTEDGVNQVFVGTNAGALYKFTLP